MDGYVHDEGQEVFRMRSSKIDFLKGFAILCVVFFHMGLLKYGYLGVDIFLVVAGYLTARSLLKAFDADEFSYFGFLYKRISRVLPIVLLASAVALLVGLPTMLPDDLENLCQSVVATTCFANNVLQCITTRNYWDVVNEYKPLMHTWYLGVLFQFYFAIPLLFMLGRVAGKAEYRKTALWLVALLSIVSFAMYVGRLGEARFVFYYLPWRFFEFGVGACLSLSAFKVLNRSRSILGYVIGLVGLLVVMMPGYLEVGSARLIVVVLCTALLLCIDEASVPLASRLFEVRWLTSLGKASLSIYVWHQIVLAFMRYCIAAEVTATSVFCCAVVIGAVAWLSYVFIENKKSSVSRFMGKTVAMEVGFLVVNVLALLIHVRSGVLYDIPELEIVAKCVKPGLHKMYNNKNYRLNHGFSSDSRLNVLVIGDSYARDWINVLQESVMSNKLDISYAELSKLPDDLPKRFHNAQYVFYATMGGSVATVVPKFVTDGVDSSKYNTSDGWCTNHVFLVGTKYFGKSQGVFFCRRFGANGHSQFVPLPQQFIDRNAKEKEECGRKGVGFVDLIGAIANRDGDIPVFSDEGKFISQDCRHLTHGGAVFLAKKLNDRIGEIFR